MRCSHLSWLVLFLSMGTAHAGVFGIPHFVEPTRFTLGLEPEWVLTNGASLGMTAKVAHGVSDIVNVYGAIGSGGGNRRFRVGGGAVFDVFPDAEDQPGIGLATQLLYVRQKETGQLEATLIPYLHKAFDTGEGREIEPFISLPFGVGIRDGDDVGLWSFVVGALMKQSESVRFSAEMGIRLTHSETYFSGGVIYYH